MKKIRRRAQGEPAPAFEALAEAAPVAAVAPAEGPRGNAPAEALANGDAPREAVPTTTDPAGESRDEASADGPVNGEVPVETVPTEMEERGPPAPAEEVGEGASVAPEPMVAEAEVVGATPAPPELTGGGEAGADCRQPAPSEAAAEEPTAGAREATAPAAGEEGRTELASEGVEFPESSLQPSRTITRRAVRKAPADPLRPTPRLSAMEDALQAEHLLERLCLPRFCSQIRQHPTVSLLDAAYVSVLQMANEVLGIRDSIIQSSDTNVRSLKRAAKYQNKCSKITEKFKKKLEAAKGDHATIEAERDDWRS